MIRFLNTAILLLGCLLVSSEPLFPGNGDSGEPFVWETWIIPADVVSTSESTDPASARKPRSGFAVQKGSDQWDASEFIKSMGVKNIPGAEATYDVAGESLVVKDTQENIATIGSILSYAGLENPPAYIVAEFRIYECTLAPDSRNGFLVWPSYATLAGKESKDVRLVDRISGTTKSGHRSKYFRRTSSGEQNAETDASKESSLGNQDLGIEAGVESVMTIEHYIDTNLDFRWRGQLHDLTTASLSFTTTFTSIENRPVVVQVSSRENAPGRHLVVTANFWRESSPAWTLESLSKIARKVSAIEKNTKSPAPPPEQSPP